MLLWFGFFAEFEKDREAAAFSSSGIASCMDCAGVFGRGEYLKEKTLIFYFFEQAE